MLAALVLAAGFTAGLAAGTWRANHQQTSAGPLVAVMGFHNVSGQPEVGWLSAALSGLLVTELSRNEELRIVTGESLARIKTEEVLPGLDTLAGDTLQTIRRNLGADYVVLGSYIVLGEGADRPLRLDYRLQHTDSGNIVVASSESGTEADLFRLVAAIVDRLRARIEPPPE